MECVEVSTLFWPAFRIRGRKLEYWTEHAYIYMLTPPPETFCEVLRLAMGRTCKDFRKLFYMVKYNHT